jgi:hypothetical protein
MVRVVSVDGSQRQNMKTAQNPAQSVVIRILKKALYPLKSKLMFLKESVEKI